MREELLRQTIEKGQELQRRVQEEAARLKAERERAEEERLRRQGAAGR